MTKEERFYKALWDVFVGVRIEGRGGFVNLMRIKSNYYRAIEGLLKEDVDAALKDHPSFRDELFDKLYSFFRRYFTESGSIYFGSTPFHDHVYERVYTPRRDIILFWKTRMLYYVKTDRIFRSLPVEFDGLKFYFDASQIENKKANERRSLVYELSEIREDGTIVFNVQYSERGRKTKLEGILKAAKKRGMVVSEEEVRRAFRIFEKQNEVDFFINKNAGAFLKEQFKLWSYRYFWEGGPEWIAERVNQLQILKKIAFKIIDFISQFEDELVKIWNKPKFVKNAHYVITLERITDTNLLRRIVKHGNMAKQIKEWKELGIVNDTFREEEIFETAATGDSVLSERYKFLPLDTKYFKDLELEILGLFENLDESLDGWLIKSENYQALKTALPKFRGRIQVIYIDPPFNLGSSDLFLYRTNYKDANWATLLENRLALAKKWLHERGSIFVRCDYNGNWIVRCLMDEIFDSNFRNEIKLKRKRQSMGTPGKFEVENESLFYYAKSEDSFRKDLFVEKDTSKVKWTGFLKQGERRPRERRFLGKRLFPPKGQHFSLVQEKVDRLLKEHFLRLKCEECGAIYYFDEQESGSDFTGGSKKENYKYADLEKKNVFGVSKIETCLECGADRWKVEYLPSNMRKLGDDWTDIPSYSDSQSFATENSEALLERVIESSSREGDIVMDFFLGSGTTAAVAQKLGRRWIGVEMGEHFNDVILRRMKRVLAYDGSGISKKKNVKKKYNAKRAGGFFKYYELEQYEEALAKCGYDDGEPFKGPATDPYQQYVFLKDEKMLAALEIDHDKKKVEVNVENLYPAVDLAETISNLTGKRIRRIEERAVVFEDGSRENTEKPDHRLIKPLLWWE
ncbi:MAG: site-specific DNA-methyltransferase [Candidatus Hydrogenedentota bacterium]|nr:MAG: site-specific DNA-methyltransferase [Candidatus Hydrogenedentota bacterium]